MTAMTTVASLMLAMALPMPGFGQHRNHEQTPPPRHEAPRREAPRTFQQGSPARQNTGAPREFRQSPQTAPRSYSQPRIQDRSPAYRPEQRREVPHPSTQITGPPQRPVPGFSQSRREVPRPPNQGQPRPLQGSQYGQEQRREVAHPPAPIQPRPAGSSSGFAQGPARPVPRPPPSSNFPGSNPQGRVVPRPPQAGRGGEWLRSHRELPPAEQQKALQSDPQFRKLPPQQQERLQNRLQRFNNLPPQQQQRILNRAKTFNSLSPQQQAQVRQLNSQWKQLPAERQQMMKTAIGDLRAMPPDQREKVLDSPRFQGMFSDQERNMLRETAKLPLAPAQSTVPRPPQQ